ncbi:hypothetical protein [Crateriforma conspicua]|uniref:Uncharacterized protein n=1 Tax=Crateriforma conspicua TaxID=2527996 RepID=A0A5C5YE84_9PLAN|nr:hypothetical protein [Crateriforma conspicua]TWT72605.1 hypothetical protein Pan14r_49250 [Crateriforma conspicua]
MADANPYDPPTTTRTAPLPLPDSGQEHVDVAPRRFRFRVIPASLCLLLGVPLVCMSLFWLYEIWNTTISSDHEMAFRSVPPVLFTGMALGGVSFLFAFRRWLSGRWRSAILTSVFGWFLVYAAFQIAVYLVPDAA